MRDNAGVMYRCSDIQVYGCTGDFGRCGGRRMVARRDNVVTNKKNPLDINGFN